MPLLLAGTPADLDTAARRLADGSLVALPTETVYGLGARADDDVAVARVFAAKGRPSDHPLIVHVADVAAAERYAASLPPAARKLMDAFWPGPVTVIVPRRADVGAAAAGGQDTIGLRCPGHPMARALLERAAALGVHGVAAPSANRFGRISPTRAAHVMEEFAALGEDELAVLDGGDSAVGIESAIVDCSGATPRLLRPGSLSRETLRAVLGELAERDEASPRASGTLEAHYAPRAKLRLMGTAELRSGIELLGSDLKSAPGSQPVLALYSRSPVAALLPGKRLPERMLHRPMPDDAARAAHDLFADLRELDAAGVRLIWVETPPDTPEWEGVRDRLTRAAAA
jgi:L-threonylcarbamoyladenylate synthase